MLDILGWILGVIFCFGCAILWGQYGLRYIVHYRLEDAEIKIVSFGFRLARIRYNNIAIIKKITTKEAYTEYLPYLGAWRSINRVWGSFIFIQQKGGFINKNVLITPDNADEFIAEVKKHLSSDTIVKS